MALQRMLRPSVFVVHLLSQ